MKSRIRIKVQNANTVKSSQIYIYKKKVWFTHYITENEDSC